MCNATDLKLSLKSDTFNALTSDFDQVLRATLSGMVETEQNTAEVNVKVKITLTPDSAPDYSVPGVAQQTRSITKPKFDHSVSSVIQRKENKSGSLAGNYELVWDRETCTYVMRPIDNGQMNLFDQEKGEHQKKEKPEAVGLPAPEPAQLPPASDETVIDADYTVVDEEKPEEANEPDDGEKEVSCGTYGEPDGAYEHMKQFVGAELKVIEAMGNITVRTAQNRVVLSSAFSPKDRFYCSPEKLTPHVGHPVFCIECVSATDGEPTSIDILCEECGECIFSVDAPHDDGYDYEEPAEEQGEG